eukprot:2855559-Prymnesium_polylepis.1
MSGHPLLDAMCAQHELQGAPYIIQREPHRHEAYRTPIATATVLLRVLLLPKLPLSHRNGRARAPQL